MTSRWFAVVAMLMVALVAHPAHAQTDPSALLDKIKSVTEQLDLTADQKTKLDGIFKKTADDLQSANTDLQNATQDEKTAHYRGLLSDLRQQVGEVLTEDQRSDLQEKLQTLRSSTTTPASNASSPNPPRPMAPGSGQRRGGFGQNGGRPGGQNRPGQLIQRLKTALDQLGLTPDQQTQIDDLFKDMRQQMQAARSDAQNGNLDRDAARQKMVSIVSTGRTKMAAILTPDQLEKLHEAMQQNLDTPPSRAGPANLVPAKAVATPAPTTAPVQVAVASSAPAPGQAAPEFSLKAMDGQTVGLTSYNHKLLVLVLGSYTNPSFRDRAAGLEALRDQYGSHGVTFLIVYTRETHPTGGWEVQRNKTDNIDIAQPKTQAERNSIADRARSAMKLSILIAPDTMDDKTATAYAVGDGTPAYLISRDGKILFHQSWLEPMTLGQAIADAVK